MIELRGARALVTGASVLALASCQAVSAGSTVEKTVTLKGGLPAAIATPSAVHPPETPPPMAALTTNRFGLPTSVIPRFPRAMGVIGSNGAALVAENGGALIGGNGASVIGSNGAAVIGSNGAAVLGSNGAAVLGSNGASLGTGGGVYHALAVAASAAATPAATTGPTTVNAQFQTMLANYAAATNVIDQLLADVKQANVGPNQPFMDAKVGGPSGRSVTVLDVQSDHAVLRMYDGDTVTPAGLFATLSYTDMQHGTLVFRLAAPLTLAVATTFDLAKNTGTADVAFVAALAGTGTTYRDHMAFGPGSGTVAYTVSDAQSTSIGVATTAGGDGGLGGLAGILGAAGAGDTTTAADDDEGLDLGDATGDGAATGPAAPTTVDTLYLANFLADGSGVLIKAHRESNSVSYFGALDGSEATSSAPVGLYVAASGHDLAAAAAAAGLMAILPDAASVSALALPAEVADPAKDPLFQFAP